MAFLKFHVYFFYSAAQNFNYGFHSVTHAISLVEKSSFEILVPRRSTVE